MSGLLAHAGHWLVNLIYLAPLVLLIGAITWGKLKERRAQRAGTKPAEDGGA